MPAIIDLKKGNYDLHFVFFKFYSHLIRLIPNYISNSYFDTPVFELGYYLIFTYSSIILFVVCSAGDHYTIGPLFNAIQ